MVAERHKPEQVPQGGLLRVRVFDWLSLDPLPGAQFTITETQTHTELKGTTSETGGITQSLAPGLYTLKVNSIEYYELQTKPFVLRQGYVLRLDVSLGCDI
ncbi:hypothetical protein GCM10028821_32900 [Hymenobacter jeollabukensis]